MHHQEDEPSAVGRFIDRLEENAIALMLGIMVILTFVNVIRRYVFNASLIWSLEVVLMLFAWMVLLGISYGIKKNTHLGVDALTNVLPKGPRKGVLIVSALICVVYAVLLMKGAYDYWAPFAGLDVTSGRWFPTGFIETRSRAFMETDQVPMPFFLNFLADLINDGDSYSKLPDFVPYTMLPFACALILLRFVQAFIKVLRGTQHTMIVSHEAEEAIEDLTATHKQGT
ncbi:TRAP transporter small permease [Litoreibacter arenae]|uniref:TRAP transporter small permease protein n=1 Tax=Litoreibacter arenae DSM 19593 TaxID=1123360 RepID=S9QPS0_9RHOB|nr:TRAP transporter small permease [Litoreibacter arenae]EPX81632.1 TRAP-type transport system, small permease component, predicted N-acetylneuraminate transporter [Litoreibacter arenae DSM 19593]